MSYATDFIDHLTALGLKQFTHRDILIHTNTNCSYSVLSDLKMKLYQLGKELREEKAKTGVKTYYIEDKK